MARPDLLTSLGLTQLDLVELYEQSPAITILARDLGTTVKTLKKHLRLAGLNPPWNYPPRKPTRRHTSLLAAYLRNHRGCILPSSVPEITAATGLNRFVIHQYLYRRQERFLSRVVEDWSQFLFRHQKGMIFTLSRRTLPLHAIKRTYLTVDKFSLVITARFHLRDGSKRIFKIDPTYFRTTATVTTTATTIKENK